MQGHMHRFPIALAGLVAGALTAGCAHERTVVQIAPGQEQALKSFDPHRQTLLMKLEAGQVIPLDVVVESEVIGAAPGASVPLTVKKDCWVRVDDRGVRLSEDGEDFDRRPRVPGTFQFGLGITPQGTRATLRLATPVR
jgi:hypothetical protein